MANKLKRAHRDCCEELRRKNLVRRTQLFETDVLLAFYMDKFAELAFLVVGSISFVYFEVFSVSAIQRRNLPAGRNPHRQQVL